MEYLGQPAKGANVIFFPENNASVTAIVPSGIVGDDGKFEIITGGKPGAPAGKYKVVIKVLAPSQGKPVAIKGLGGEGEQKVGDNYVTGPFANRETTTISFEVSASSSKVPPIKLP